MHRAWYWNPAAGPASSSTFVTFPGPWAAHLGRCCQISHLLWPRSENSLHIKSSQDKNPFAMFLTMIVKGKEVLSKCSTRTVGSSFCGSCDFGVVERRVRVELREREVSAPCFRLAVNSRFGALHFCLGFSVMVSPGLESGQGPSAEALPGMKHM